MTRYYAIIKPPKFTLDRPLGLVRVTRDKDSTRAQRVGEKGEWVEDRSLLADVWGLGGASGTREISAAQARETLERLDFVKDADRLIEHVPARA